MGNRVFYEIALKKYTPEDTPKYNDLNARGVIKINGELTAMYARILIKRKKTTKRKRALYSRWLVIK